MSEPVLSLDTRKLFVATPTDEQCLERLIGRMSDRERQAFWLSALVIDGAVTVEQALAYWCGDPIPDGPRRPPRDGRKFRHLQ